MSNKKDSSLIFTGLEFQLNSRTSVVVYLTIKVLFKRTHFEKTMLKTISLITLTVFRWKTLEWCSFFYSNYPLHVGGKLLFNYSTPYHQLEVLSKMKEQQYMFLLVICVLIQRSVSSKYTDLSFAYGLLMFVIPTSVLVLSYRYKY